MDDRRILELYPLPIACAYRRYRNASEVETFCFKKIPVDDGCLDIELVHGRKDNPSIAAIEIEPVK